jgi:hypothetical protein
MKFIVVLFTCATVAIATTMPSVALSQDDVRGAFLVSRPKEKPQNTSAASRPSRRRPRPGSSAKDPKTDAKNQGGPVNTGTSPGNTGTTQGTTPGATPTADAKNQKPAPINQARMGLGLTLFMRDSQGLALRTDPSRVFQKGDGVRVLLETNSDGYLYVFNTTDNGPAVMLYPNAELDEAGNYLQAHVPFEVPASANTEERLRWLVFDENAGDERLFFVFTREPLAGVPIEDELIAYCTDKKSCTWKPTDEVWARIQKEMGQPLQTAKAKEYGAPQTQSEQVASSRGLGLAKDDPPPSLIMMASSNTPTLVATLNLIHK